MINYKSPCTSHLRLHADAETWRLCGCVGSMYLLVSEWRHPHMNVLPREVSLTEATTLLSYTRLVPAVFLDLAISAAVNDPPTFTPGSATVTVDEGSGADSRPRATNISPGPGETGQTVGFSLECQNRTLYSVEPQLSPGGVLTFTPAAGQVGTSNCVVTLSDNVGSTAAPVSLAIVVAAGRRLQRLCRDALAVVTSDYCCQFGGFSQYVDLIQRLQGLMRNPWQCPGSVTCIMHALEAVAGAIPLLLDN
jgi:hypothetical protein